MNPDPRTFEQARAEEELNALLAHLPYARPLLGVPVVPLRWAHELELGLSGNALFVNIAPLRGDFEELLWRLHPYFTSPDGCMPNLRPGARRPGRLTVFLTRLFIWLTARRLEVHAAEIEVRDWLAAHRQDEPGGSTSEEGEAGAPSRLAERVNQFDSISEHFSESCGYTPEQILQLGVAWSWQHYRVGALASGDPKLANRFIRPSAALVKFERPAPAQEAAQ